MKRIPMTIRRRLQQRIRTLALRKFLFVETPQAAITEQLRKSFEHNKIPEEYQSRLVYNFYPTDAEILQEQFIQKL